ncbi:Fanconi anemia group D2 protein [Culex quinquefasciatus]|uniref:Fanconi anemia group D2 protein n=1 Tax=Culex quinquefasciatus TaxID=7176 RepID=UPI0018E2C868|nr:Fanconi anemia group D2 protein [Culex quinquefasciatus]XP_038119613.1 Fanconi anemia group D2 protein [Culex quinquefasciatus]
MFKNRKTPLLAKKSSDLATIRESSSDGQPPSEPVEKVPRVDSGPAAAAAGENDDPFGSSQFSVPASQMCSQRRYLSQRTNLQKSQSARTSRRVPVNYFEHVLLQCQVDLDDPTSIVLRCEPIAFVRTVRSMLRTSPDYPRNVQDFVKGFEQTSRAGGEPFRKLLECCQLQNRNTGDLKPVQESLMKMLLCVEFMQLELITVLFECVERLARDGGESGLNLTGLVLSQIKYIDHTVHGSFVFNKYFEVLERCQSGALVREAIVSLQDVIDVSKQDEAFGKILELLPRAAELFTSTNLTVFCQMCLSGSTLRSTRQKVVGFVEGGCPVEVYPALVKFLLKFNGAEVDTLHENIYEIRQVVQRLVRHEDAGEKQLEEIFQSIYQALTVSGVLYDAWVKFSRMLTDEESHTAVDLLVLLMMLTVNELKSGVIQKILANKLKKQHLTVDHMEQLTKRYGAVLKTHMDCVLDFVESCLKERQTEVCEFGVMSMSYLFSANSMNNKLVLNKLVGFMCEMALINEAARNDHLIAVCMNSLSNIHEKYPNDIRNCAHILLKMMDVSTDLSLEQYRSAVSIICDAIQIPDQPISDNESWDSINIIIKKQLLSNHKEIKKKGVIGVVRMIHHLLKNSAENPPDLSSSFDSDKTIESATDIPTAAGREIGNMFNLMIASSNESNEILALCYDELAEMLNEFRNRVGKPERAFTVWLCDVITNEFQNFFVIEEIPTGDVVQFAKKLCINEATDIENTNAEAYAIAVNIADVLQHASRYSAMCFFLAMFKLMKSLQEIRYEGNLESINALLGCAIVVPTFYDEPDEKTLLETFEEDVCRQILDAYFYVANWFRELINAFIEQSDEATHKKVIQRLSSLVHLEQRLAGLLRSVDFDYVPPICDFLTKPPPKAVARFGRDPSAKPSATQNATRTQLDQTNRNRSADGADADCESVLARYRVGFRAMDGNTIALLRETLILDHKLPDDRIGQALGLPEYRFLLETLTSGIEAKVSSRAKQHFPYKVEAILEVLPRVVENYTKIKAKRRELSHSTDKEIQVEFKALTSCFNWSLRCFTGIVQLVKLNPKLLEKTLNILNKLTPSSDADDTNDALVEQILSSELSHKNACKDLFSANCLYNFAITLKSSAPSANSASTIATFCQKFICTDFHRKTGTTNHLNQLLQGTFVIADFTKIKRLTKALAEDLLASKNDTHLLAGLQRPHYPLLFKELAKAFLAHLQAELRSRKTTVQRFVLWEQSCEILKQFSEVAKQADNFKIYGCYMRYGHTYIKLFQQLGLKTLEDMLKASADRVSHLLSTLQHSTRYLHNICCHSKSAKDKSLAAQVPFIRETVENLIYSVKAVLAANDCSDVFWMGNLKNKDLRGDLLLSQQEPDEMDDDDDQEDDGDIGDFLSDDEEGAGGDAGRSATTMNRRESTRSSQSKCF